MEVLAQGEDAVDVRMSTGMHATGGQGAREVLEVAGGALDGLGLWLAQPCVAMLGRERLGEDEQHGE